MNAITPLSRWVARAIVVEQLNPLQWHATVQGWDVPPGSLESQGTGVNDFDGAMSDAFMIGELTGLPVLVHAFGEPFQAPREAVF
jgi:hypothetical protein